MQFEEEVLVPRARAKHIKEIEKFAEKEGIKVEIIGNLVKIYSDDALNAIIGKNAAEAIGRGFEPSIAKLLFRENFVFEQLALPDYGHKRPSHMKRVKGVVIGEKGKAKNIIEKRTNTKISIYGKTVSIIGETENVLKARKAVEMLLTGRRHATAYRFLETRAERSSARRSGMSSASENKI